jgi:DNA-binding MarR family transcriptional regulator
MTTISSATLAQPADTLEDARDLSQALSELIRVVQFRDRDRACCYDVSVTQCYALKAIVDGGALTVNEVAGQLYLDKSTASRVADALESKGYIRRERAAEDRRVVLLTATAAGHTLHKKITTDLISEYADLLDGVGPEVRAAMTRLLGRLATTLAARVDTSGGNCCVVK